jgi:hypothetical protein
MATKKRPLALGHSEHRTNQLVSLVRLTAAEMVGFIVLEVIMWLLVVANFIPPTLVIKRVGLIELSMNTGYLVLIGLIAVLVASFWLAILVQLGIVKLEEVDFEI